MPRLLKVFNTKYHSIVWTYHSLFHHSPTEGHLGCFHALAIMNKAAINICAQVLECAC